jgi:hypothetical protein
MALIIASYSVESGLGKRSEAANRHLEGLNRLKCARLFEGCKGTDAARRHIEGDNGLKCAQGLVDLAQKPYHEKETK